MRKLKVGKPAPDVGLVTLEGKPSRLSEYWGEGRYGNGRSALLIFMRHLA